MNHFMILRTAQLCELCEWTLNADFDGDVLNHLALTMEEFWDLFDKLSPVQLMINRIDNSIKYDLSALENISLSILSDM